MIEMICSVGESVNKCVCVCVFCFVFIRKYVICSRFACSQAACQVQHPRSAASAGAADADGGASVED